MDLPKIEQDPHTTDELHHLREENARLKALLSRRGITWEKSPPAEPIPAVQFTTADCSGAVPMFIQCTGRGI
jgi:hypothetical protein